MSEKIIVKGGISCDICKYGEMHDYIKGNYYCNCKNNYAHSAGDEPMVYNCPHGEVDLTAYNYKYKPFKKNDIMSKEALLPLIDSILAGADDKSREQLIQEVGNLRNAVVDYRQPNKCETCALEVCERYAAGVRGCDDWR